MSKLGKSIPNMSASIDSPFSRDTTSSRRQTCPATIVAVASDSFKCTEASSKGSMTMMMMMMVFFVSLKRFRDKKCRPQQKKREEETLNTKP